MMTETMDAYSNIYLQYYRLQPTSELHENDLFRTLLYELMTAKTRVNELSTRYHGLSAPI